MGVDTKGYISKEVTIQEVYNVILTKYDPEAKLLDIEHKKYSENDIVEFGSIYFKDGEDNRRMFVYRTIKGEEERTSMILGYWNNSVDIMANVVKVFGGEVLENDCSGLPALPIPKDEGYKHSDRIKEMEKIINLLDENLSIVDKTNTAIQIIKHKDQLKELL